MALSYLPVEIRGVLPSGWNLAEGAAGVWDAKRKSWSVQVVDPADVDWPLRVEAGAAAELGRLEALRRAVDVLYREALG